MKAEWEDVATESLGSDDKKFGALKLTARLKVPGGWLYRYERLEFGERIPASAVSITFVPTPPNY